ncbi:MAG: hypothetical protein AAF921_22060 [Cyanobacteria bacterium P01_D01_bin.44]
MPKTVELDSNHASIYHFYSGDGVFAIASTLQNNSLITIVMVDLGR